MEFKNETAMRSPTVRVRAGGERVSKIVPSCTAMKWSQKNELEYNSIKKEQQNGREELEMP